MPLILKNMSFKAGKELKISGKPKSGSGFSINIGHDEDRLALHFNPRFDHGSDVNVIVCNSNSGGDWGDEHREGNFPFQCDEEFKMVINFNNEEFFIKLPDGNMMSFPNRFGDDKFMHIHVAGDVKIISIKIK